MVNYKEVIESRYNRENWILLLHDIFGKRATFWPPTEIVTNSPIAKQASLLGKITLSDEQTIAVYEVELSDNVDIERNRRGIRDMLATAWKGIHAGAFMFCYRKNESVLRFSYVSESWNFADNGTYQKESTDTKRFTYLLGEGHRSRTAIQQFEKLRDSNLSLKDLTKAFSVDAVSDMFFDGYKKQYEDIIQYITGKRMVKVANKWEEQIKNDPCEEIMKEFAHFQNPEKAVRDYVKKLMGRLVFLQFLQKKSWLGVPAEEPWGKGDTEFIQTLFAQCNDKEHFVDNVLEVLFNDLNTEREGDLATPSIGGGRGRLIPYLNGGLFERDATDETEFPLPAKYMQSLLDFFASYNFTIDENDPDDAEVGVDPEMLGRIFENLLEDNKDKGAFYTPKEIVSYMCRESLIAYLQTDVEDEPTKEAIRQFVTTHNTASIGTKASPLWGRLEGALRDVKICDPAIGSGAFPMGLLKELFQCRTALEGFNQHQAAEIKKHIIQQNIYGVDIERGAVDIARLRFWLSLIVDEETPQALPNLDFKIMQGNSLLEQYKGVDLSTMTEKKADESGMLSIFDSMLDVYRLDLRKMLAKYYDCTDHHEKQSLRKEIVENVKKQLREQSINVDFGDLYLSGNNQFFLWHTWFYDVFSQGGFDIVIGNPPYVVTGKGNPYSTFTTYKCYELYAYFYEHSLQILKNNGILSFITASLFVKGIKFESLRNILNYNSIILKYRNEGDSVFDNVQMPTCTIILKKGKGIWTFEDLSEEGKIAKKIGIRAIPLSTICNIQRGFEIGRKQVLNNGEIPFLTGSNVDKYRYSTLSYISYSTLKNYAKDEMYYTGERLLIRETGSELLALYLEEKLYCNRSLYSIKISNKNIKPKYLLACINSRLLQYYYRVKFRNETDLFPKIRIKQVKQLPITIADKDKQSQIETLINLILATKSTNPSADTSALESEIDHLVYQLYGLTEEEIKIVEGAD